ncbi:hypothetical protein B9Q03_04825 [Candidatus Marsarchaeota G2 archaeon OSP_D]|jgi:hypothetical protein|uniref:Uncharacterized protein n=6 Tax=Candidatus Marsarchaeota group 2 TaxID=2203771 RepID=A0A2R6CC54_9ARCH|nr:MAG: hypothetical protein B9Q03_04825 [Candidatus Marsarchaeota G2 archaeon OSP_D]PSN93937.1 MAG: hypothetical protein B9Q09_04960 [Candidatus Marsarchaeota G2 archaeon ECH_B_SAG-C16]PSN95962.1 MAG: hypothetical protein B9Q06_03880 [Candidatus Marsarchaeota G2 archaeon ECH_B_2]PSO02536.1 MAG: hypothetical protein B9Q05_04620 [Candidatus Marsarchaeota G2 archaeon ECH_B_1]PSO08477.1 MAG: hypothetical protein B9Q04_05390 [Candidatus Marsarchaeota G2 archaeon BE_D]
MPAELLSEQLVLFLLIIVGGLVVSSSVAALGGFLKIQARVVGQEKLAYFFDFVGYAWTDRVNTLVAPPADTAWLEASGTTLRIHVNGTTYTENYPFSVYAANTTNPTCLNIRYTAGGVYIVNVEEALCSWRAS